MRRLTINLWDTPDAIKTCKVCGVEKKISEFSKDRGEQPRKCKKCHNRKTIEYRKGDLAGASARRAADAAYRKNRYHTDPAFRQSRLMITKFSRHNMKREEFDRMLVEQEGRCACCGRVPKRFEIDHDHHTGEIRGLLCGKCNTALGLLQDTVSGAKLAVDYLERKRHVVI